MEDANTKISKRVSEKMQVAILIVTVLAICLFIIAIIVLVKNVDEIKQNPIDYGIDKYGFDMCTCTGQGAMFQDFYGSKQKQEVMKDWTS